MRFQNGCNEAVIKLRVVKFWSEILVILGISNQTCAAHSFDFEVTRRISDKIALHSIRLPLKIMQVLKRVIRYTRLINLPVDNKIYLYCFHTFNRLLKNMSILFSKSVSQDHKT